MNPRYPPIRESATEDYVLSVLVDEHRQQLRYDPEAEPDRLEASSTIDEWRHACDLVHWRRLAGYLGQAWEIEATPYEWKQVLEPSARRTLGGLCRFIALRSHRPAARPSTLLGSQCETAGMFRTMRHWLAQDGADVRGLRPSSPLAPLTRLHPGVFLTRGARLAPGRLPEVTIHHPLYNACVGVYALCLLVFMVTGRLKYPWFMLADLVLCGLAWLGMGVAACLPPRRVDFGSLKTFRDLCECLAAPGPSDRTR